MRGPAPLEVTFDGAGSTDPADAALTYLWNLGDGTTSSEVSVTKTYSAGNYSVSLVVSNAESSDSSFVSIEALNLAPHASIVASAYSGQAPLEVAFDGSNSSDANGDALTFAWDFGDGDSSTEVSSAHTFDAAGDFTVVLLVSDGMDSHSDSLTVSVASGVPTERPGVPERFVLEPAYPNPFNPSTTVTFGVPHASGVTITISDILGRKIATPMSNEPVRAGYHTVSLAGHRLAPGAYLIRMEAGGFVGTQKVLLLR